MRETDRFHNNGVSATATLVIMGIVQFVVPFMLSAVGIALPAIGREYHASALLLSACITSFVLSLAIFMLPVSRFADIYGRKRIFSIGVGVITMTTIALALSPNVYVFIAIRFIQGLAAAMIFSTGLAILTSVFPIEHRGRALGISASAVYLGMAAGPTLAGFLIAGFGWRSIFYFVIPIQLLAVALTMTKLHGEWTSAEVQGFDWIGSMALCCTLLLLIIGTTQLNKMDAAKYIAFLGLLSAVIFFRIEQKVANPLLDLHLLRTNLPFTFNNVAVCINYAAAFGVIFLFSLYLQNVKGYSPKYAGLVMVIQPGIQALLSPLAGKLSDTYSPRHIAAIGIGSCTVGLTTAAFLNTHSSLSMIILVLALLGLGFGLFSTSNTTAIMGSVEPQHYGIAAGLLASMRNMGMLISMTIVSVALGLFMGNQPVSMQNSGLFVTSMRVSFILFSVLSLFGVLFTLGAGVRSK
jgi:MFS family permease